MATERTVTIATLYRNDRTGTARLPFLRLSGRWLEQLGFTRGTRVSIAAEEGKLVLTVAPDAASQVPWRRETRCANSKR